MAKRMPGGPLPPTPRRKDEDSEKYLDPYAVLTDARLKKFSHIDLKPSDNIIIDTAHYQRGPTTEVRSIAETLKMGGILPAVKTAVRRKDGTIAIVDGGQTMRACNETNHAMSVRLYEFDDIELEAKLFYVLNRLRPTGSDIRIRACDAPSAAFLRELNDSDAFHNIFWKPNGDTAMSATAVMKSIIALFFDADDQSPVGMDISVVMKLVDPIVEKRSACDKVREFLHEVKTACSGPPPTIVTLCALASVKRRRGLKPFLAKHFKVLFKVTRDTRRTTEALREFSRQQRIEMLTDTFEKRLRNAGIW